MDFFSVLTLIGGLSFFLFGMHIMSSGLEKISGGKLEKTLDSMTSNPFKALLLGAGITIAIQSSSAMTVMLVGLVNSGIMQLSQTVGVIMGSNIGTTLTAWILSLTGIKSDNFLLNMLKPESFSPLIAFAGIMMIMMSKKKRKKDTGYILVGFAVLMYGMELMSGAVEPLSEMEGFQGMLTAFKNPLLGVLVGTVFTGIIQSSAASVGVLQALSLTGGVSYEIAIPIILGQNIGTCVTSLISSIGVNKNAKRVAAIHILFNVIGALLSLVVYYVINAFIDSTILENSINPFGIAAVHSVFNIVTTIVLFPFRKMLVKLAEIIVRNGKENEKNVFIDVRLLNTPAFAISECNKMMIKMADIAKDTIEHAMGLSKFYDQKIVDLVYANEEQLDSYEDKLGSFLVKLSNKDVSDKDSKKISGFLHTIGDFERIGDHSVNIVKSSEELKDKNIVFSDQAQKELEVISEALREILYLTVTSFKNNDLVMASKVEPLEQVIDGLIFEAKSRHIARLQKGECTIKLGFVFNDYLSNYERVSDHCSNIAVAMIEVAQDSFDTHQYLSGVKSMQNVEFKHEFDDYSQKYKI